MRRVVVVSCLFIANCGGPSRETLSTGPSSSLAGCPAGTWSLGGGPLIAVVCHAQKIRTLAEAFGPQIVIADEGGIVASAKPRWGELTLGKLTSDPTKGYIAALDAEGAPRWLVAPVGDIMPAGGDTREARFTEFRSTPGAATGDGEVIVHAFNRATGAHRERTAGLPRNVYVIAAAQAPPRTVFLGVQPAGGVPDRYTLYSAAEPSGAAASAIVDLKGPTYWGDVALGVAPSGAAGVVCGNRSGPASFVAVNEARQAVARPLPAGLMYPRVAATANGYTIVGELGGFVTVLHLTPRGDIVDTRRLPFNVGGGCEPYWFINADRSCAEDYDVDATGTVAVTGVTTTVSAMLRGVSANKTAFVYADGPRGAWTHRFTVDLARTLASGEARLRRIALDGRGGISVVGGVHGEHDVFFFFARFAR